METTKHGLSEKEMELVQLLMADCETTEIFRRNYGECEIACHDNLAGLISIALFGCI